MQCQMTHWEEGKISLAAAFVNLRKIQPSLCMCQPAVVYDNGMASYNVYKAHPITPYPLCYANVIRYSCEHLPNTRPYYS